MVHPFRVNIIRKRLNTKTIYSPLEVNKNRLKNLIVDPHMA